MDVLKVASYEKWFPQMEIDTLIENFQIYRSIEMSNRLLFENNPNLFPKNEDRLQPLKIVLEKLEINSDDLKNSLTQTHELFNQYLKPAIKNVE